MPTSESSEIIRLKEFLAARGIDFVTDIQANRTPPIDFALSIPGDHIASLSARGQISPRQMKLIQNAAKKEIGLQIEWIVTPSQKTSSMEAALQELLNSRFPESVSAVFFSPLKTAPVSVWLERNPKDESRPELAALRAVVEQFLKLYDVTELLVMDGDTVDSPTNPMIMRRLKVVAPATREQLADALRAAGSTIPDLRWLQSKLDALRKEAPISTHPVSGVRKWCRVSSREAACPPHWSVRTCQAPRWRRMLLRSFKPKTPFLPTLRCSRPAMRWPGYC